MAGSRRRSLIAEALAGGRKHVRMVPSREAARMKNTLPCFNEREPGDFDSPAPDLPPMLAIVVDN